MSTVVIRPGSLEGFEQRGVHAFRGIPYAEAPRGPLRWRAPRPAPAWGGLRDARRFGASSPQAPPAIWLVQRAIGVGPDAQSQDCLHLNVWTPGCDARRRPVMVWIHGGAFTLGSGSTRLYDGTDLARCGDVVVVTLNYRLGALGFLDLSGVFPGEADANAGLRDQIAALRWVREHIEAFGGDPENVTIFGESAGGMSVGALLGAPEASGLFQRAICQSGAAHNVSSPERAKEVAECFLTELRCDDLADLRSAKVADLLAAQRRTTMKLTGLDAAMAFQPSIDGDLLPAAPIDAIAQGASRGVATLVGSNRHEWRLFMMGDRRSLDADALERRFARALPGSDAFGVALARRAALTYAEMEGRNLRRPRDRWEAFQSDRIFHHPAHRLAAEQAAHAPTWAYQFSWVPPGPARNLIGACHGIEIPFVFGTLHQPFLRPVFATALHARRLSRSMQRAWTEFARCGDPRHDELPDWPAYGADAATLRLTRRIRLEHQPFREGVRFWSEVEEVARRRAA